MAENLWRHLTAGLKGVRESVHLCDYPDGSFAQADTLLNTRMDLLREIASLGRSARMDAKLKVRQPLGRVEVTLADGSHIPWLTEHDDIIREELNVKEIHYASGSSPYVSYSVQPNFRRLGPRVGPLLPKLKQALASASGAQLMDEMSRDGKISLSIDGQTIELDGDDIQVRFTAKSGWAAAQGKNGVVALHTELTPELIREGIAKDAIRIIQDLRKKRQCDFTDRIAIEIITADAAVREAIDSHRDFISQETLAVSVTIRESGGPLSDSESIELADVPVSIALSVQSRGK
jgi:isoleucyl-tRNA synthetase